MSSYVPASHSVHDVEPEMLPPPTSSDGMEPTAHAVHGTKYRGEY